MQRKIEKAKSQAPSFISKTWIDIHPLLVCSHSGSVNKEQLLAGSIFYRHICIDKRVVCYREREEEEEEREQDKG